MNPAPLTRSRGQVMADTLTERITGQARAEDVNVEVQVVVPLEALVDPDSPLPAEIPGHGPVPADSCPPPPAARPGGDCSPATASSSAATRVAQLHRPARRADPGPGPLPVHRVLLRRPHPRDRPHHPSHRRRTHHVRPRPRNLPVPQPTPRTPRMVGGADPRRSAHHHPDRTHLPLPHPDHGATRVARVAAEPVAVEAMRDASRPPNRPRRSPASRCGASRSGPVAVAFVGEVRHDAVALASVGAVRDEDELSRLGVRPEAAPVGGAGGQIVVQHGAAGRHRRCGRHRPRWRSGAGVRPGRSSARGNSCSRSSRTVSPSRPMARSRRHRCSAGCWPSGPWVSAVNMRWWRTASRVRKT